MIKKEAKSRAGSFCVQLKRCCNASLSNKRGMCCVLPFTTSMCCFCLCLPSRPIVHRRSNCSIHGLCPICACWSCLTALAFLETLGVSGVLPMSCDLERVGLDDHVWDRRHDDRSTFLSLLDRAWWLDRKVSCAYSFHTLVFRVEEYRSHPVCLGISCTMVDMGACICRVVGSRGSEWQCKRQRRRTCMEWESV